MSFTLSSYRNGFMVSTTSDIKDFVTSSDLCYPYLVNKIEDTFQFTENGPHLWKEYRNQLRATKQVVRVGSMDLWDFPAEQPEHSALLYCNCILVDSETNREVFGYLVDGDHSYSKLFWWNADASREPVELVFIKNKWYDQATLLRSMHPEKPIPVQDVASAWRVLHTDFQIKPECMEQLSALLEEWGVSDANSLQYLETADYEMLISMFKKTGANALRQFLGLTM